MDHIKKNQRSVLQVTICWSPLLIKRRITVNMDYHRLFNMLLDDFDMIDFCSSLDLSRSGSTVRISSNDCEVEPLSVNSVWDSIMSNFPDIAKASSNYQYEDSYEIDEPDDDETYEDLFTWYDMNLYRPLLAWQKETGNNILPAKFLRDQ